MGIVVGVVDTPFGPIHLATGASCVLGVEMRTTVDAFRTGLCRRLGLSEVDIADPRRASPSGRAVYERARHELVEYAAGERTSFTVALDVGRTSGWDRRVFGGVRSIAFGTVTSYGRLAGLIGARGAARAVGASVGRNPIGLLIPCHRVIAGDGSIGGYGGSWFGDRSELLALKRSLLAHEGVLLPARGLVG
jgi:methylated-DNA-[protein]-cysteine S-methyltransferase